MNSIERGAGDASKAREVAIKILETYADKNDFQGFFNKLGKSLPKLGVSLANIGELFGLNPMTVRRWTRGNNLAQEFAHGLIMDEVLKFLKSPRPKP